MSKTTHNGNGRRRERLNDRIDRAVALRDREMGIESSGRVIGPSLKSPDSSPITRWPDSAVPPPTPPPGPHLPTDATLGIPGTPIVSGFLQDLGEYNGEMAGRNALPTYEKM